mgnify:CR=1 FL=1
MLFWKATGRELLGRGEGNSDPGGGRTDTRFREGYLWGEHNG